jgi:tRNA threonylcarbamoyladenosine biosynthesis protein TsaB
MHTAGDSQQVAAPRLLLIDTSHRLGLVALAEGERVLGERRLDEARRHARDLVPAMRDLLVEQGWRARELAGVVVSRGPGSYTGLRVGVMSAKTLAYAAGCKLLAIDTFAAIAWQAPPEATALDVIADAQQEKLYVQRFTASAAADVLRIQAFAEWQATLADEAWVSGPGLEKFAKQLPPHVRLVPQEEWFPRGGSLLRLGLARLQCGEHDDPFVIEPIYLRPSSAEEKWQTTSVSRER